MINRRHFLKTTTLSAAAALAGTSALDASPFPRRWRMRLCTSSIQFKELSIDQVCAQIARLGFEAIDIWSGYDHCPHLDAVAKELGGQGLKHLLARHRLKLCSFSTYVGGYGRYAELLGEAGGGLAIQGSAPPCRPQDLTAKMKEFLEGLAPLLELAERHNSYLAIENHGDSLLDSLDSFKAFVDLNRSPRLGLALAPYHLQALGAPATGTHDLSVRNTHSTTVEQAIRICGSQLLFFYAWQNQPGLSQLPGLGPTDFKPWLRALAAIEYRGYVNPFMHGHPTVNEVSSALAQSRRYLKNKISS
jgi:sugar phosphate isomerase/epimerase